MASPQGAPVGGAAPGVHAAIESVGIIGSGTLALALTRRFVDAQVAVTLSNSRGPDSLRDIAARFGDRVRPGTVQDAVRADLSVLAVPFVRVPQLAEAIPDWSDALVVDATNQFAQYAPYYSGFVELGAQTGSEWVRDQLPGATVIKAFGAMYASFIEAGPRHPEGRQVVFYAADDDDRQSGTVFGELLARMGFAGVQVGSLHVGGRLLQLRGPLNGLHVIKED